MTTRRPSPHRSPSVVPQAAGLVKIVVTVARVDAKVDVDALGHDHDDDDDSWVTLAIGPFTLDLLSLQGGSVATLGVAQLPAGDVDSLRLVLQDGPSNYVVTSAGTTLPLVVPSDEQTGIRVTGDFDAQACATGHVTLEFAGRHSIEIHPDGDGDAYILRPVIHLREVDMTGVCPDSDRPTQPPSKGPRGEGPDREHRAGRHLRDAPDDRAMKHAWAPGMLVRFDDDHVGAHVSRDACQLVGRATDGGVHRPLRALSR